jgi:hypothetical protein
MIRDRIDVHLLGRANESAYLPNTGPYQLATSSVVMGVMGTLCRGFLYGFNKTQTTGLERFVQLLRKRESDGRQKGLITVCNHISV